MFLKIGVEIMGHFVIVGSCRHFIVLRKFVEDTIVVLDVCRKLFFVRDSSFFNRSSYFSVVVSLGEADERSGIDGGNYGSDGSGGGNSGNSGVMFWQRLGDKLVLHWNGRLGFLASTLLRLGLFGGRRWICAVSFIGMVSFRGGRAVGVIYVSNFDKLWKEKGIFGEGGEAYICTKTGTDGKTGKTTAL
jgi:hypothetical protein